MIKFPNAYVDPKLNQEDLQIHLNIFMSHNVIEAAIKNLQENKSSGPDRFSTVFYQKSKEELIITLLKLFHDLGREGTLPN
jgi:hypothetical protein